METLLQLIIRISIGSALFYAFYMLMLRKTTFLRLNRIYLLAAVLLPLLFALFPLRYTVLVPGSPTPQTENLTDLFGQTQAVSDLPSLPDDTGVNWSLILLAIYCTGLLLLGLRLLLQSIKPIHLILKNKQEKESTYPIVKNKHYPVPFSFFNHIFIHPDYHRQEDLDVILAHEEVHIRERHWIDLLVIELFTLVFWFNPISWLLEQAIKQNHEYLADQGVLSRGQSPARYQLLLVNQLMGMQVLGLSNNLNFALGPTRLNMMKQKKTSRKQLLRFALILPVVAVLLFAFAQPEYKLQQVSHPINSTLLQMELNENNVVLTGTVENEFNIPMPGASIIIQGTTIGTIADSDGKFKLELPAGTEIFVNKKIDDPLLKFGLSVKMPDLDAASLIFSYVGYEKETSSSLKGKNGITNIDVKMSRSRTYISTEVSKSDVPPPPIPDDKQTSLRDEVFVVVEEMPQYPGGHQALAEYIQEQTKKYMTTYNDDFTPKHFNPVIGFTVSENGSVTNLQILKGSGVEKLTQYAAAIVKGMEDWTPGRQRGKAVPVDYAVRIEF